MNTSTSYTGTDVLQARLAARLAAGLGEQASNLPHDVAERLRFARELAVQRAREQRVAVPAAVLVPGANGGAALLGGPPPRWWRLAAVLPLLVLVSGLVLINHWSAREQVLAAADIDSSLLADDLPPAAYADPGFAEFLKSPTP